MHVNGHKFMNVCFQNFKQIYITVLTSVAKENRMANPDAQCK